MFRRHRTLFILASFMTLTLAIIIANVFVVTLGQYHVLSKTDLEPYVTNLNVKTKTLQSTRGSIYDRDGNPIATDGHTFNLYAVLDKGRMDGKNPAHVVDVELTANALAPILGMSVDSMTKLLNQDVYQTEFGTYGRGLSLTKKEQIEELELPGIEFTETFNRSYPLGVFASNLIGLARYDDVQKQVVGQWGLEALYEDLLQGANGSITYQQDIHGYILDETTIQETPAVNGNSIYLTLDQTVQEALEQAFQATKTATPEATNLFGAVMEVETGKILAWGQSPSYNPNSIGTTNEYTFMNYGLQGSFEPGSTFKAFSYAAAIDTGVANMDELHDSSTFLVGVDANGNVIRSANPTRYGSIKNYSWNDWGLITYREGFARSSNTAVAELFTRVGADTHLQYIKDFGFLQTVNPDRFSDTTGFISYDYPREKINTSFGQGISVSVIQMLQAYTAIMGDGQLIKPYFIDKVVSPEGEVVYQGETEVIGQPIRPATAATVRDLMHDVIYSEAGGAKRFQVDGVDLIGKTGTSQIVINGVYDSEQVVSSVMLGFPYEDPQVMIYYGYQVAQRDMYNDKLSSFKNLIKTLSLMYDVSSDPVASSNETYPVIVPNMVNHSLVYGFNQANQAGLNIQVIGDGKTIKAQLPLGSKSITNTQKVFLLTDGSQITMPDMTGWTKKDVVNFWTLSQIEIITQGSGLVTTQSIAAGEKIDASTAIYVTLE